MDVADATVVVNVDPVRINQVLTNLLRNASKYTRHGGRIELRAATTDTELSFVIKDNGVGIPVDSLASIFELFVQLDRRHEIGFKGLGIGLNLVRSIVDLHGGTIDATSPGRDCGSEFRVRLPIQKIAAAPPIAGDRVTAARPTKSRRVLLVDDNPDVIRALSRLIGLLGHQVCVAVDGRQAVNLVADSRPDVVLMDIGLPGLNGYDAARAIRALPGGRELRLVALTGWGQASDRQRAADAGFDEHITKPATLETLRAALDPDTQARESLE